MNNKEINNKFINKSINKQVSKEKSWCFAKELLKVTGTF